MEITSTAFKNGKSIPQKYSCDGKDVSPPLSWSGVPDGTKSFALISDDPDAPVGTWIHWVLYNIPVDVSSLEENIPERKKLANGAMHGVNDFKKYGYGGPCPPGGTHRYYFKLYALRETLDIGPGASKKELLQDMEGKVIAEAQLMGTYSR